MSPDPRVTLARPDLAAADLEGVIRASRYVAPIPMQVAAPVAPLRRSGEEGAEQLDQMIFGEMFDVLEIADGQAWGQARRDGYVGFVARSLLRADPKPASHRVSALATFALASPAIRATPTGPISLNALVAIDEEDDGHARAAGLGWLPKAHLAPIGSHETDFVAVAERHLGVPYHWGGRTAAGLDCSGLVMQSLLACGGGCPRDTDQQALLGEAVSEDQRRRGDLVFWRGHVAILLDGGRIIHANAHHMAVAIEPYVDARGRIAGTGGGEPTAIRRL
ncbi:MAG: NlpC/P60 family protein [Caulobacteraceae bacterium]